MATIEKKYKGVGTVYLFEDTGVLHMMLAGEKIMLSDLNGLLQFCADFPNFYKETLDGLLEKQKATSFGS